MHSSAPAYCGLQVVHTPCWIPCMHIQLTPCPQQLICITSPRANWPIGLQAQQRTVAVRRPQWQCCITSAPPSHGLTVDTYVIAFPPVSTLTAMQRSRSVRLTVLSRLVAATLLIWGQCSTDTTLHSMGRHDTHELLSELRLAWLDLT